MTSFDTLPLSPAMLANLASLGYREMTPIQAASLPALLDGQDVIAQAMTGSGKTAAFGIALLNALNPRFFGVQSLVLCPTRELADQVTRELRRLARHQDNIKILTLCGGAPMGPQLGSLAHGAHVVVGTPGRVLKHLRHGSLQLSGLRTLVLDEADRMLDMGFHDDMVEVASHTPAQRQTLLFSATFPDEIRTLSQRFQRQPLDVRVAALPSDTPIEQWFHEVDGTQRLAAVMRLLRHHRPASAILFCNTKQGCDEIATGLRQAGFQALALHGDLEQRERDDVLVRFSHGSCPLLVATDVAARGLDIQGLAAVINVELAFDPEVHIHRIGRTGRAGQPGLALSLCAPAEVSRANAIEDLQRQPLRWQPLPDTEGQPPAPPSMATLVINGGRRDKLRPGDILGALTGEGGLKGEQVGKIDLFDTQAYVAVTRQAAHQALERLNQRPIKGRAFKARRL